jgi:hypothetical protein
VGVVSRSIDFPYKIVLYRPEGDYPEDRYVPRKNHEDLVCNVLNRAVPVSYIVEDDVDVTKQNFLKILPLVSWSKFKSVPFELSFFLVCKLRHAVSKFFYEMIHWWLLPGRFVNITSYFATDFIVPEFGDDVYTACELGVWLENDEDLKMACCNLPSIEAELRLGTTSLYHANRILEVKGLSVDIKTAMIQEYIVSLMHRKPAVFNYDIFMEMQHFLVVCEKSFTIARDYMNLGRIIVMFYILRRNLRELANAEDNKRHVKVRVFKANVHADDGTKSVLSIVAGINFLGNNEVLEEHHLMKAIKNILPGVSGVKGSFFNNISDGGKICTMYLEIFKDDGRQFTTEELKIVRKGLPTELKGRIAHLMYSVFMPRNEEEVMRNILTLDGELRYVQEIPQGIISFDKQTDLKISFTVVMVRVLKDKMRPIVEMFAEADTMLAFFPEQVKVINRLRKKYDKEANVFRVELDKADYLRKDHSLDLYKARRDVVCELEKNIGKFRDYNGGLITKQNEVFCLLRDSLDEVGEHNVFLLENFFYSLVPSVMRNVIGSQNLGVLFKMFLRALDKGLSKEETHYLDFQEDESYVYGMLMVENTSVVNNVRKEVGSLKIDVMDLGSAFLVVHETPYLGFIYRCTDATSRDKVRESIKKGFR